MAKALDVRGTSSSGEAREPEMGALTTPNISIPRVAALAIHEETMLKSRSATGRRHGDVGARSILDMSH